MKLVDLKGKVMKVALDGRDCMKKTTHDWMRIWMSGIGGAALLNYAKYIGRIKMTNWSGGMDSTTPMDDFLKKHKM